MNCDRIAHDELLGQYVKGRLGAAHQDELECHLMECAQCQDALEVLAHVAFERPERHVVVTLPSRAWKPRLLWAAASVASLLLVGVGTYSFFSEVKEGRLVARQEPGVTAEPTPTTEELAKVSPAETSVKLGKEPPDKISSGTTARDTGGKASLSKGEATETALAPPVQTAAGGVPAPGGTGAHGAAQATTQAPAVTSAAEAEINAELFRLGIVDPYPYTFSGYTGGQVGQTGSATPQPIAKGGTPATGNEIFQRGMIAYVEGRYRDALPLLERAAAERGGADATLYLGVCLLLRGKPKDAIEPLEDTLRAGDSPYSQVAHFYLAKTHIQTRDLAAAQVQLKAAADQAGRLSEEARALLVRVRELRSKMP